MTGFELIEPFETELDGIEEQGYDLRMKYQNKPGLDERKTQYGKLKRCCIALIEKCNGHAEEKMNGPIRKGKTCLWLVLDFLRTKKTIWTN